MENEIVEGKNILSGGVATDSYRRALKKNEAKVLAAIGKSGYNLSADQLYQMSEDFFQDGLDKFIFEDFMGEDHCPILAFSDTLLEKIYQKPEKFALGKSRFFEAARLASANFAIYVLSLGFLRVALIASETTRSTPLVIYS